MKTVSDSFVLPCSTDTFLRVFFNDTYANEIYTDGLGFKSFQILELGETARKTLCVPKMNLPGPLEKLVGDSFAYEEHGTLDRARSEWTWRMVQPTSPGAKAKSPMVTTRGTMRIEPAGEGSCRRSDTVEIEAKMFGIGGMIESTVEKEVRAGWAKEVAFLKRWLDKPR